MLAMTTVLIGTSMSMGSMAAAATTVNVAGGVKCSGDQLVTGVWVQSSGGGSGFASWYALPGFPSSAQYFMPLSSNTPTPTVSVRVGCGGNPSSWGKTIHSSPFTVGNGVVLNFVCNTAVPTGSLACSPPPSGPQVSSNPAGDAYRGWCTWGSYEQWKANTRYYPNISGHANQMDESAESKGFYVERTPYSRSLVVFNGGPYADRQYGHVGWVTNVYKKDDRVVFDHIDMNGNRNSFGKFVHRFAVPWDPAVQRFILAPP